VRLAADPEYAKRCYAELHGTCGEARSCKTLRFGLLVSGCRSADNLRFRYPHLRYTSFLRNMRESGTSTRDDNQKARPGRASRTRLITSLLNFSAPDDSCVIAVTADSLVSATEGLTGMEVEMIIRDAAMNAVRATVKAHKEEVTLCAEHFLEAGATTLRQGFSSSMFRERMMSAGASGDHRGLTGSDSDDADVDDETPDGSGDSGFSSDSDTEAAVAVDATLGFVVDRLRIHLLDFGPMKDCPYYAGPVTALVSSSASSESCVQVCEWVMTCDRYNQFWRHRVQGQGLHLGRFADHRPQAVLCDEDDMRVGRAHFEHWQLPFDP
jgi:SpoVK/Ycf46/Vps4 family AAA+-type ATPase